MKQISLSCLLLSLALPVTAIEMVEIPAGMFSMGMTDLAAPVHPVTLTQPYLLGRTELTNAQLLEALNWAHERELVSLNAAGWVVAHDQRLLRYMMQTDFCEIQFNMELERFELRQAGGSWANWGPGITWPHGYNPASHPANHMTWYGAATVCDWLSLMEGLEPFYHGNWDSSEDHNPYLAEGYRLPTEAEWEHAARYPDGRVFPWGNDQVDCSFANCRPSYPDYCRGWTVPVGSYEQGTSATGLMDLAGNINEWVNDWHSQYPDASLIDPIGPQTGQSKILRGGSWGSRDEAGQPLELRSANRRVQSPLTDTGSPWFAGSFGVRIARSILETSAEQGQSSPASIGLTSAYPNPFNPTSMLSIENMQAQQATLSIFDLRGRLVETLFDGMLAAGQSSFPFNAAGHPAGIYLALLNSEHSSQAIKLTVLK